jgi:hypothetical protein
LSKLNESLHIPDLDRLCILAASFLAASDIDDFEVGAGATVADLIDEGAMDDILEMCSYAMEEIVGVRCSVGNHDKCQLVGKDRNERQ